MPRLTKDLRQKLLGKLRNGHDIASASASLDVTEAQVKAAGAKLQTEVAAAFKVGTGKLRARLLELSLSNEDASALSRLLDRREQSEQATASNNPITRIERVVITAECEKCGHRPSLTSREPRPSHRRGNGAAT